MARRKTQLLEPIIEYVDGPTRFANAVRAIMGWPVLPVPLEEYGQPPPKPKAIDPDPPVAYNQDLQESFRRKVLLAAAEALEEGLTAQQLRELAEEGEAPPPAK